jgi:hypothetical protein
MQSFGQAQGWIDASVPPAAIANAMKDALCPFGVEVAATPLSPEAVHTLIERGCAA